MAEYTYNCQHCGDTVTSTRKRSGAVNCAPCARMKDAAVKNRTFAALASAMESGKGLGLTGAEYREYVQASAAGNQAAWRAHRTQQVAARETANAERAQTNALLRQHGYRWSKLAIGSEDDWAGPGSVYGGTGEVVGHTWELFGPDDRIVTLGTALTQIKHGAVPTKEQAEQERVERTQRIADLVAAGYVAEPHEVSAYLNAHTPPCPLRQEAEHTGFHWFGFRSATWLEQQGKEVLRYADESAIITGDRAKLLHQDDLLAIAQAANAYEQETETRYRDWLARRDAQRQQDAADRAAGWDGTGIAPSERVALDAIFS